MTALERLMSDHHAAWVQQQWYANAEYERQAKARIKALAECHRRSIGQSARQALARIKRQHFA